MSEYELKREYAIETLADSPASEDDVIELWMTQAGLDEEEARRRLPEVVRVATDAEGELCGISTAYVMVSPQLGLPMWHIRAFVADEHRAGNLASNLLLAVRLYAIDEFQSGRRPDVPGAVVEVENMMIEQRFPQAIWPYNEFVFIGVTPTGAHLRVFWFDGARVPPRPLSG